MVASGQDKAGRAPSRPALQERSQIRAESGSAITLDPPSGWDLQEHAFDAYGNRLPNTPANFRRFGEVKAGEVGDLHTLTLHFAESVSLTHIQSTPDFQIEKGGSCVEGGSYEANTTCTLLVRFTPQGPGNRLGHLVITNSVSGSEPVVAAFGLGGTSYEPVVSFVPAVITTLPGTYPSSVGLLSGAQNLAIDGADTLYVADTGHGAIRYLDSGGAFKTLASGYTSPYGIAVDSFGEVYSDEPASNIMYEIFDYGPVVPASGTGTGSCPVSSPCTLDLHQIYLPGELSIDPYNHLFWADDDDGAAMSTVQPEPANLIFLYDPFPYQDIPTTAFAVDASDNLYTLWATSTSCEIQQQTLYNAENANVIFNKVAGGRTCGFSGNGVPAGNAEIGSSIGQIVFDAAGDMYFSDTNNQRVRRIDYNTGIIRTIAGDGTAGYTGDGSKATSATLHNPTGVGVDSQGDVYIISSAASGQVIRKVGPQGFLGFGKQTKGVASAAQLVTVTNTGNSEMTLTNVVITGTNAAAFKVDNTTTTCVLTSGASLYSGQTCRIGVIFTPGVVAAASATLTLLDNTINGADSVTLSGTGVAATTVEFTAPLTTQELAATSAIAVAVSVTAKTGPAPTGNVDFSVDGTSVATATLVSGKASAKAGPLAAGTHTVLAAYSGDKYHLAHKASEKITVSPQD